MNQQNPGPPPGPNPGQQPGCDPDAIDPDAFTEASQNLAEYVTRECGAGVAE